METVKLRKDQNHYIAYFVKLRKIIYVNKTGAIILDNFFNENLKPDEILRKRGINHKISRKELKNFLLNVKKELNKKQDGYPLYEESGLFSIPLGVELQVNEVCNLRCKHCYQKTYTKSMSFQEIKQILKILYQAKVFEITLTGGEVFLHPRALEIIKLCCEKYSFATNIVTNATLINSEMIEKLANFDNKPYFLISLEGPKKINDKIRGRGVFNKVDKVINQLKKDGFYIEISCTVHNQNIKYYQNLVKFAKSKDIPCNFNLFKPFKKSHNKMILKAADYFKFIINIDKASKKRKTQLGLTNAAIIGYLNKKDRKVCRASLSGLTIDLDKSMIPCALLRSTGYYGKQKMPKLDEKFKNKWLEHPVFKNFRKYNLHECQACALIFSGNLNGDDPYGLKSFKKYMQKRAMGVKNG